MGLISTREIRGNRGDIASRYGILQTLLLDGQPISAVFAARAAHLPEPLQRLILPYGPLYNLWPHWRGIRALWRSRTVIWTGGLDLQDDSSLLKLLHCWLVFTVYRCLRLKILVVMQGAGPLATRPGRWLARRTLSKVDLVLARDSGSYRLLSQLMSPDRLRLAADGIFLPGIPWRGEDVQLPPAAETICKAPGRKLIGVNVRMWFHFAYSIVPYQFRRDAYRRRAAQPMRQLMSALVEIVARLRHDCDARIVLLSMYEPGADPWEDDMEWLQQIKAHFAGDPEVVVMEEDLSVIELCGLFGRLDLMIGTRLHSTLIALRTGVPAIHIGYTLKGPDIFNDFGLSEWVIGIDEVMRSPGTLIDKANEILGDQERFARVRAIIEPLVATNERALLDAVHVTGAR